MENGTQPEAVFVEQLEQLMILSSAMNPTRNNILSNDLVKHKLNGWRQYNALQHIEENLFFVSDFLKTVNFTNFDLFLLEKLINKVKINGLLFLIDKVDYKDCNGQICTKNIELFQGFYKNNSFIMDARIKKFLKIITRNLINNL